MAKYKTGDIAWRHITGTNVVQRVRIREPFKANDDYTDHPYGGGYHVEGIRSGRYLGYALDTVLYDEKPILTLQTHQTAATLQELAHDAAAHMHEGLAISAAIERACNDFSTYGCNLSPMEYNVVFTLARAHYNEQRRVAEFKALNGA
jgi:hypothetical protein